MGVNVKLPSVSPATEVGQRRSKPRTRKFRANVLARVFKGVSVVGPEPDRSSTVTGPVAPIHSRVKGWPSWTLKLRLVMAGLARPTAARALRTATETFMVDGLGSRLEVWELVARRCDELLADVCFDESFKVVGKQAKCWRRRVWEEFQLASRTKLFECYARKTMAERTVARRWQREV